MEVAKMWKMKTSTVPVAVAALGLITKGLGKYINEIPGPIDVAWDDLGGTALDKRNNLDNDDNNNNNINNSDNIYIHTKVSIFTVLEPIVRKVDSAVHRIVIFLASVERHKKQ